MRELMALTTCAVKTWDRRSTRREKIRELLAYRRVWRRIGHHMAFARKYDGIEHAAWKRERREWRRSHRRKEWW